MVTARKAILIGEAIGKIMSDVPTGEVERISLMNASGRYLAEDLIANADVPAFDRSLYDGYAISAEDTKLATTECPIEFEVVGHIGAGAVFHGEMKEFQAVRIMTGAEVPKNCNAIVMLEHVKELKNEGRHFIAIDEQIPINEKIFKKGSEISEGTLLVKKGARITPGVMGLLATFGYSEVLVGVKPKVGVLATGSELLEVNEPLAPGKIRNSNSFMLMAQIEMQGAQPIYLGKLEDDLERSYTTVEHSLKQVDLLITTGGVSVGDFDYLPEIYNRLGAEVLFNKIAMRPGSVTTVAKVQNQFLFGLSGNPSASFIGFELFVKPVLKTLLGNMEPYLISHKAILAEEFPVPNAYTQLIRTKVKVEGTKLFVSSNGLNMSSSITSLVGAEALVVLPPSDVGYEIGCVVDFLLLSEEGQKDCHFTI
ncbi:gephyrin-like molybdotransferase Glp [Lysinibacillus sp. SGAir0095]|uniref:molybdopterin molybdotransferase MoeA n=1 Tax=Lysinibacillus sp. SGAir0095 TaxID=2070463 RepID=UPI0010CD2F5B|nr:gephyrin-like molybdotransferase Glp [Lysinibacillus sp. SGAir0095]QCR32365.1 molybdopterin molybdenumtransferase [Lysinibacillus sp. SGAir0095]